MNNTCCRHFNILIGMITYCKGYYINWIKELASINSIFNELNRKTSSTKLLIRNIKQKQVIEYEIMNIFTTSNQDKHN